MSAEIFELFRPDPSGDPPADRAVAEVLGEGTYLGAVAIDDAEGDYALAVANLEAAVRFVKGRQLVARARRLFGDRISPEEQARQVTHFATELQTHRPLSADEQMMADQYGRDFDPGPEAA